MPRNLKAKSKKMAEAKRLIKLREKLGMSQQALAREWYCSQGTIWLWERGDRTIPGPVLKLIEIYEKGN